MPQSFLKDPSDELDYRIDWSEWLAGSSPADTIASSTWAAQSGITIETDTNTTSTATVWLSGGEIGRTYEITNRIVTAAGRTKERTLYVSVVQQ